MAAAGDSRPGRARRQPVRERRRRDEHRGRRRGAHRLRRHRRPPHRTSTAMVDRDDVDAVIVYSGDGGFNEALNGLDEDIPIGFLPGGGTSVLPRPGAPARRRRRCQDGQARPSQPAARGASRSGGSTDAASGSRGHRARRGDRPARGRSDAASRAAVRTTSPSRGKRRKPSRSAADASSPASRSRERGPQPSRSSPTAIRTRTPARSRSTSRRRRAESGSISSRPRTSHPARCPRFAYAVLGRGQTEAADVLYRHDADRFEIRCSPPMPSRSTVRTSATSSARRSRRSATQCPFSP